MSCVTWCNYEGTVIPDKTDPDAVLCVWSIGLATFSAWYINELLGTLEGDAPVLPTQLYTALHSTASTKTTAGTELSGNGYARVPITFERVSDIQRWNLSDVIHPAATDTWDDILSFSIWDDANPGSGNYYAFGNTSSAVSIVTGKTVKFPANTVIAGIGT